MIASIVLLLFFGGFQSHRFLFFRPAPLLLCSAIIKPVACARGKTGGPLWFILFAAAPRHDRSLPLHGRAARRGATPHRVILSHFHRPRRTFLPFFACFCGLTVFLSEKIHFRRFGSFLLLFQQFVRCLFGHFFIFMRLPVDYSVYNGDNLVHEGDSFPQDFVVLLASATPWGYDKKKDPKENSDASE